MKRLTNLVWMEVVNEHGKSLGRVMDVRSPGEPEHGVVIKEREVSELICGTRGLLIRLGIKKSKESTIPWKSVIAVRGQKIIVKAE